MLYRLVKIKFFSSRLALSLSLNKNFGQKSAEEVIEALQKRLGITLPQEKAKA